MFKRFTRFVSLALLLLGVGLFGQISNRPSNDMVHRALSQSGTDKTLSADDLNFELTDFYSNSKNGIQHIYLRQTLNGLEVIGTESSIHVSKTGKVASVSNKFLNSIQKRGSQSPASPQIDAVQAVSSAAMQLGYHPTKGFSVVSQSFTADKKSMISDGGISLSDIPARLMYFADENGNISLVWDISIEAVSQTEWYNVRVDAKNGKIIDKVNWTNSCDFGFSVTDNFTPGFGKINYSPFTPQFNFNPNVAGTYNVFAMPLESPLYGGRTMVLADDAVNFNASPYGWHDTDGSPGPEYNTTRGNNVNAYEDGDHSGYQPDGGSSLIFDFPYNMNYSSGDQSEDAAITNLFYWNNIIHDVFYEYGFNEVAGNFQQNNYGKGGLGNDYVRAEAQDGSGTCNANFSTPPDGSLPRMQMYICGNRDGDFDNMVIAHEYGHGISNRLTGGPSNTSCLNNQEQMGEGWSDFFGLMLTMRTGDQGSDSRGVGTYLFGEGAGGPGIRTYPYSTNMSVNPHTYNSIKTEVAPHGVGSVWCAMLWEMTWGLIDEYGFDPDIYHGTGGNNIALQLVVEGLALQPCSPGFVDGRDAILLADQMLYGGANQCIIWDAFAKRGLGYSANQGSSGNKNDGTEAFDTPSSTAAFTAPADVCEDRGIMTGLSGGTPMGGVYSGPGVTDNGNGMTYSFDPSVAGVGVHTITYSVPATQCSDASSASDEIEVTAAILFDCPADIEIEATGGDCSAEVSFATPEAIRNCTILNGEDFDGVGVPNLPAGWTTQTDQGTSNNWKTVNDQSSSSPNSAFAANLGSLSLSSLTSPEFQIASTSAKLKFDIRHVCESGYDGAVLEYTTDNGATWKDILNGGGTFASGGYTHTLSTFFGNPLGGRQAWSGSATTFKNAVVNLNASMNGQTVKFRWRMGSDSSVGSTGVWIDSVEVEGVPDPAPITVTQTEGLPSGSAFPVGTNVVTFQADDGSGFTTTCSFNVIVTDAIAPVINCPADMSVSIPAGSTYTLPDYWANGDVTATDNCSSIDAQTQNPVAGTSMNPGVHTIQFTVTDSSGNSANCNFQLTVSEDGGGGSDACFTEDFSDITNGNSTETTGSSTVWNGNTNFPTVEKAYQAGGAVKLGTASLIGSIESRDLTEVTGDITVNIMVKGWTNVEGDLKVSIDGQDQILSYTAKMADPFEQVTATFTGVAAGSNLKIETTAKRAFIDNVEIICDGGEEPDEGCQFSSGYGSAAAPADICNPLVTITTCNFAGEYATVTGVTAGTEYEFASSISTDYLTIRQGTYDGPIVAAGITPLTVTAAAGGNLYIHIAADEDCNTQNSCRATTVEALNLSGGGDYCLVTSTNTTYGIDSFVTTGGVANIDNSGTGPGQYTDYTAMFVSQVAGSSVDFDITGLSTSQGYGIWVDWSGSDFCFADGDHHVYNSGGYINGATGTITVPPGTPAGDYRMRVVGNWLSTNPLPCGGLGSAGYGEAEDYTFRVVEQTGGGEDCDQGDDSNGFENGFNIIAGGTYRNADDFFVSAGSTLNIQQIELNVFAEDHFATMNFNFYEDDGGKPGSTIVESLTDVPVTTVGIGSNFGYIVYATFAEVNLTFTEGHYWMQPEANTGGGAAFWEITTAGSLGDPIATSEAGGAWEPDADGSHGVFKLYCEPVEPPEEGCLFDITADVEPITRVVLSDIDNSSSPEVNGSPALEDFTSVVGHLAPGTTYDAAFEGNTNGPFTNYFTIWIDFDQNGTYESSEMFEIGSIYNSTGTDGQQAISSITIPSGALLGTTTMRVIKNYGSSPTNPCGIYSFGQGEDYTIEIEELTDCSGTPEGGSVTVNPDHGNPGSTYTVSASGYTIGNGLTYQWQSNTDDAGWVNEGTAMSGYSSYTATAPGEIGSQVEWRLEVTCTNSGQTALSTTDIFTVEKVYCEPEVLIVEPITRVVFADIDNSSDPNSNVGYEDFTAIVGNVNQTVTYPIALEGNTEGAFTNYFTVWVDWNQNGTFESSEMYEIGTIYDSTGTDGQQATGEITVPADAVIGETRMRVIKNFGSSPTDPCGSYTFGQIEDYTLNVQNLGTSDMNAYDFSYWPNPTKGVLNIQSQKEIKTIEVMNLAGQKVMADQKLNQGQINISQLSSATYLFRVHFADGKVRTFKVLKK